MDDTRSSGGPPTHDYGAYLPSAVTLPRGVTVAGGATPPCRLLSADMPAHTRTIWSDFPAAVAWSTRCPPMTDDWLRSCTVGLSAPTVPVPDYPRLPPTLPKYHLVRVFLAPAAADVATPYATSGRLAV